MHNVDPRESIELTTILEKVNRYGWWQERSIAITDKACYFLQHSKFKRTVKLHYIIGLTHSEDEDVPEFVLHIQNQYDYRVRTMKDGAKLSEIIPILMTVYQNKT